MTDAPDTDDLVANRQGVLSARQQDELQRAVAHRSSGVAGRLLHRHDDFARDVEDGQVAAIEGRLRKAHSTAVTTVPSMTSAANASHQLVIESATGVQSFGASRDVWAVAPAGATVRLYYLPRSRWALNLEPITLAPLTSGTVPGAPPLRIPTFEPPAPPDGRTSQPLADALVGRWVGSLLTATFRPDGTLTGSIAGQPEAHGTWAVTTTGRLHITLDDLTTELDVTITASTLTVVLDGTPLQLQRAPTP